MKKFSAVLSVFILICLFSISVFSFNIDGTDRGTEWENAKSIVLFSHEESNSNVSFGLMKWIIEDNSLYICFNFLDDKLENNQNSVGVLFAVEDSEFFNVVNGESAFYDSDKYRVEGAMSVDVTMGVVCEVRVGFKYGVPSDINGKVRFIDSEGAYSNIYDFTIENEDDYYYEPVINDKPTVKSTKAEKTTKETTTKATNTTKAKTTNGSDESILDLLDIFKNDETTSVVNKEKTTQKKAIKTTKNNRESVVTSIKIIEKEIYITEKTELNIDNISETTQAVQTVYMNQSNIKTPEGKKYQMLTAIAGSVMLITVAILGTLGANKKADKNNDTNYHENKNNNKKKQ